MTDADERFPQFRQARDLGDQIDGRASDPFA
jgi:hypothetical protein